MFKMKNFLDRLNAHNNIKSKPSAESVEPKSVQKVEKKVEPKPVQKVEKKVEPKQKPKVEVKPRYKKLSEEKKKAEVKPVEPVEPQKPTVTTRTFEKPKPKTQPVVAPPVQATRPPIENPKISIIMQSYLKDYPGARTNAVQKLKRVIASFLTQTYSNCELIIVSDGCDITHDVWLNEIKGIPRIKYAYVDKPEGDNMYEVKDGKKFYRGFPRTIGMKLATGDIITYCDSDDYLMAHFCDMIVAQHTANPNSDWMYNTSWFDHKNVIGLNKNSVVLKSYENARVIKVPNLGDNVFIESRVKEGMVVNTPWLLSHRNYCRVDWVDTYGDVSEDTVFGRRLRSIYKNGHTYASPTYIRCHYKGSWDV